MFYLKSTFVLQATANLHAAAIIHLVVLLKFYFERAFSASLSVGATSILCHD